MTSCFQKYKYDICSLTYLNRSLTSTISMTLLPPMAMSTWKSNEPCTVSNNPECLQTTNSKSYTQQGRIFSIPTHCQTLVHKTRPISFTLVVNDVSIKYVNKTDVLHLGKTISDYYPMKSGWKGDRYIGINLNWDYTSSAPSSSP